MRARIRMFILKALLQAGGQPMTEANLVGAVMLIEPQALVSDVRGLLRELEEAAYVGAVRDEVTEQVNYGLTMKGTVRAGQL